MHEELLAYLLDNQADSFKQALRTFLNNNTIEHALTEYSFLPSLFDSWLMNSQQRLNFNLFKGYRPGKLVHDFSTYILIKKNSHQAFIITINNVYQRDTEARNEIIKKNKNTVKKNLEVTPYDQIFNIYIDFLSKNLSGTNEVERAAQLAWILAHDRTSQLINNILNQKKIRYIGIANLNGEIEIEISTNFQEIYKEDTKKVSIHTLIEEIKDELKVKQDILEFKRLETTDLSYNLTDNSQIDSIFNENYKNNLEFILQQYCDMTKCHRYKETHLHAAILGNLLSYQNELAIELRSMVTKIILRRKILIFPKKNNKSNLGLIISMKMFSDNTLENDIFEELLEKINPKQYNNIFGYYNLLRIKQLSIAANKFKSKVIVKKK